MSPVRPEVVVIGRRAGEADHRLRDFLTRIAQPYEWIDAGEPAAARLLERHGIGLDELPAVVENGSAIPSASVERVAEAWKLTAPPARDAYDLVIVGAGPAGLAAAVYAASDGLATLLVEEDVPGGQASHTSLIENFFGFPGGIGGAELARLAGRQAERFGAELVFLRGVTNSAHHPGGPFEVELAGGHVARAPVVIAAPGMVWRRLGVEGVDELLGHGVYYGAGRSEAPQCAGEDVVVVGAGNSAGQATMNLAEAGARVTMLVRGGELGASMSAYLVDRIQAHPRVDVRLHTQVERAVTDEGWLSGVHVRGPGDSTALVASCAMFLCLGGVPRTRWAADVGVAVDGRGFILTGPDLVAGGRRPEGWPLGRDPLALETSVPGLFAAGDARSGSTKRVGSAVGEGAMAVALAHRRLEELSGATPA